MEEMKTRRKRASVAGFLATIKDKSRQADARALLKLMQEASGEKPVMWGNSVVGFGDYHYKYASGREGDWFLSGFSPRKDALTIYLSSHPGSHPELMAKLGKYKTGVGCIYIKRLDDIHLPTLKRLIRDSVRMMRKSRPAAKG
jgi:hypothetical protein